MKNLRTLDLDFTVEIDLPDEFPAIVATGEQPDSSGADAACVRISVQLDDEQPPEPVKGEFRLSCQIPISAIHGILTYPPMPGRMSMVPVNDQEFLAWTGAGLPFIDFFHRSGINQLALGLVDQLTETVIKCQPSLVDGAYRVTFSKPVFLVNGSWRDILRVSTHSVSWMDELKAYREFVDAEWPQPALPIPEFAYEPVFDTAYISDQDINQNWIFENAFTAVRLGLKTWITRDGWYTAQGDGGAGSDSSKNWKPDTGLFPEFGEHIQLVQKMGLHYLLGITPDQAGSESQAAQEYAQFEQLVSEYKPDGITLNLSGMVDPSQMTGDSNQKTGGEKVFAQLNQTIESLQAANPDILVELGGSWTNLANRRFANLYRAEGAAFNPIYNRWQAVMVRLLAPDRVVSLSPVTWGPDASLEDLAVTMINAICTVPAVSVDLNQCQQSHLNILRYWIGFYNNHRDAIVHGEFSPVFHQASLSMIQFTGEKEKIIALYEDYPLVLEAEEKPKLWLLNASTRSYIDFLTDASEGLRMVTSFNKFGEAVYTRYLRFPLTRLEVEVGGALEIGEPNPNAGLQKEQETQKPAAAAANSPVGKKKRKKHG